MQAIDVAAVDPKLVFMGKYKLSMMVTPRRQYLAGIEKSAVVTFTTASDQAMVFAIYLVLNADKGDVWVLQATPVDGKLPVPGGFISIMGSADEVAATYSVDYRLATQFLAEHHGEGARLFHRGAGRWLTARVSGNTPTLWLPPAGLFDQTPWQLDLVQGWSFQTMANADLRYVRGLQHVCRPGLSFAGAKLQKADFSGAYLGASSFVNAQCQGTGFLGADIMDADFTGANIEGAYFGGVDARGAKFPDAIFSKLGFNSLYATRVARFDRANLSKAVFDECDLRKAKFAGARLAGASLKKATLTEADFSKADLAGARFDDAVATRATFTDAAMTGARLTKAALGGASFLRATLTRAQFDDASFVLADDGAAMVDFTEATLYEIDFSGCDLRAARIPVRPAFHEKVDAKPDDGSRRALLCRAHVPIAVIGKTSWRMLDLKGATIHGKLDTLKGFRAEYAVFPDNYDLRERDVTGAKFNYARMVGIDMRGVKSDAETDRPETIPDFTGADLRGANMPGSYLAGALFTKATMHGINLSRAELSYAIFNEARLDTLVDSETGTPIVRQADLSYANLVGAKFDQAYLDKGSQNLGANLGYVKFHGDAATMMNATLTGAIFNNAYLTGVNFTGGNAKSMEHMNFTGACLLNCTLKKASLLNAVLTGACLLGADFTEADLSGAAMTDAMVADAPGLDEKGQFIKNELVVSGVSSTPKTLEYARTLISEQGTNRQTRCPSGNNGPCNEPEWKRKNGRQTWTYGSKLGAEDDDHG
jgi:uncharacterized protein YjbI with pentapeptide repeats